MDITPGWKRIDENQVHTNKNEPIVWLKNDIWLTTYHIMLSLCWLIRSKSIFSYFYQFLRVTSLMRKNQRWKNPNDINKLNFRKFKVLTIENYRKNDRFPKNISTLKCCMFLKYPLISIFLICKKTTRIFILRKERKLWDTIFFFFTGNQLVKGR